ncbi:hypothetical protein MGYG_03337 [Nannizzia gypsea CBS 118893]|uniref:Hypervirulence associated protein TUDOR domain-containing protein n=1 Tax=Arthroderma gypseum (strain ATCC MYA-4604 / CBS 118893) TaxID=535722 RepID=E4UN33_ARTGP|nr:hypothetical protein MGYG_03337 [Nannizzia gypsea CBS 118893]EFR00335.1 hypothetical protein MGYG_03337 [Nannizzia gypsea CBS 118893]
MPRFYTGQNIVYRPVGGRDSRTSDTIGTITNVLTHDGRQAGRNVTASDDEPRYEVENQNTGKLTSIKEENVLQPL